MSSRLHLARNIVLTAALALAGCKSTPAPTRQASPTPAETHAMMTPQARATAAELSRAHPDFKLFRHKTDMPTILVVAESTTDDQLKNLLWFLRTNVRSGAFKALALQPTATLYGTPAYNSGIIDIYRGSKCAGEEYITSGPDPCGASIHKSASYHWGDGGDPHVDGGYLVTQSGTIIPVFDAADGWQTEAEARQDPDGTQQRAAAARIRYAVAETTKQSRRGSDLKFFVASPTDELSAVSYQFADEPGQKRFLNEYVFLEEEHLCAQGFKTVKLGKPGAPGRSYPIPCPAPK